MVSSAGITLNVSAVRMPNVSITEVVNSVLVLLSVCDIVTLCVRLPSESALIVQMVRASSLD